MQTILTTRWGMRVKHALLERGMTVTELALRIGKTRAYVSNIINGRYYSPEVVYRIAEELDIDDNYDRHLETVAVAEGAAHGTDRVQEMIDRFNSMVE